jgi:hypothetical protein
MRIATRQYAWALKRYMSCTKPLWNQNVEVKSQIPLTSKPIDPTREEVEPATSETIFENTTPVNGVKMTRNQILCSQIGNNLKKWIEQQEELPQNYSFKVFDTVKGSLYRKEIPALPEILTKSEHEPFDLINKTEKKILLDYMKELTNYIYPKRERKQHACVGQVWKKASMVPEIRDIYIRFLFSKSRLHEVKKYINNTEFWGRESSYETLLDKITIFKNSSMSLGELSKITKHLSTYSIPATPKLLYKLYYALPLIEKKHLCTLLEAKNVETDKIFFDKSLITDRSFDFISNALSKREMELTYATYLALVTAMIREHRIEEGLITINFILVKQHVRLPAMLAIYTVDKINSVAAYHGIPSALFMQRITGHSLKPYTLMKLIYMHLASGVLSKDSIDLFNFYLESNGNWKRDEYRETMLQNIAKSPNADNTMKLLDVNNRSPEEIERYEQLKELFMEQYTSCDISYRPGFDIEQFDPIFDLFALSNQYKNKKAELLKGLEKNSGEFNLSEFWMAEISPLSQTRSASFVRLCKLVTNLLLEHKQYHQIIPFVEYVKEVNKIDISYNTFLKTITSIVTLPEMRDETMETSPLMQLAALLSFQIHLRGKLTYQAFLKEHENLNKLLITLQSSKFQSSMNKHYLELAQESKWDTNLPPCLNISPSPSPSPTSTLKPAVVSEMEKAQNA